MSKIDARVGTRAESSQAPVTYELPREIVAEAIVNAVAPRADQDSRTTTYLQVGDSDGGEAEEVFRAVDENQMGKLQSNVPDDPSKYRSG